MKRHTLLFILLIISQITFAQAPRPFPAGLPTCLEDDFRELEKFYDTTGGDNWINKSNWFINPDISKWYGITLTSDGCDVKSINMLNNRLNGNLTSLNFPKLEILELDTYLQQGTIKLSASVSIFSNLLNLKKLNLQFVKIPESIPDFNLPNLEELYIEHCFAFDTIPNFSKIQKLKILSIIESNLPCIIPDFNNLPNLESLKIHRGHATTGTLPSFSKLTSLKSLFIGYTIITGTVPDYNLPKLESLELYYNTGISGPLPNFNFLPNLKKISLASNGFNGEIPNFNKCPNLEEFDLQNEKYFEGFLPKFSQNNKIKVISIENSKSLIGSIPNYQNQEINTIKIKGCSQISGKIPNFNLPNLTDLSITSTQIDFVPDFLYLSNLKKLNLFNNENIKDGLTDFSKLNNLESLSINSCSIKGKIPSFNSLQKLKYLDLSYNNLSDSIPNFKMPDLIELNLDYNKLTYCPDFAFLSNLEKIKITNNFLKINLPSLSNCKKLKQIDLNDNQLIGTIPSYLGFNFLSIINLYNNKLSGNIQTSLPINLKYLIIYNNYFNFGNLEQAVTSNLNKISYQPQLTKLPLTYINNKLIADLAGSDLSKLTYKWFRNSAIFATTLQNNQLPINKTGKYYYSVNHSILTNLTLLSDTITVGAKLKGKAFFDENNNCNLDNTEKGKKEVLISFQSAQDTVTIVTDSLGNYEVALDTFNYSVVVKTGSLWKTCAIPNIKFSSWSDSLTLNIPMQIKIACPENHVNLSTLRLRRCFDNSYTIKYANKGTIAANNAYIIVDFDKWLTVKSASKPYIQLPGNQYRFDIGTVQSDEDGIITVIVNVNCDSTLLGQTHCSTAHIYPDSACVTSSLWDNSSLTIKAKCQSDKVTFEVKNEGTAPTSQARQSIVIEDQIMMFQMPVNLGNGESKFFEFSPFGKTVRMSIEQAEYHPSNNAFVSAAVEGCGGNPTLGMITQFSINDNEPWKDTDCRQNIGAYDPNEKLAYPKGYGELHLIEPNTEIEYQINFQNEGSDTAFTVVLRDTINSNLDITTINMVSSSHPYSWTLEDRNTLKVTFNHINLTTKKEDEAKSQGFIRFRIAQNKDLPSGKAIKNRAGIYFDFNQPIMTNTTFHRVGRNFVLVAVPNVEISNLEVKVSPNPLHNQAIFEIKNTDSQNFTLKIFDQLGRILHQQSTDNGQVIFQNTLSQGIYFYRIENEKGMASGKLMIY